MENHLAIVGMACRFPGARNLEEFWANLIGGVESISRLSDDELLKAGVPAATIARSDYVKAAPVLDDPALFDAAFFGFTPSEAATMDPQHRLLLELSYSALEDAACDTKRFQGRTGVFVGSAMNTYFMNSGLDSRFAEDYIPTLIFNDKDFLGTRLSYKLGLRGPSMTVQTACSTSLVAIHLARQSLLNGETDMALAGAVSVRVPHRAGYFYDGAGVVSPDGHVRAFDAGANGTVFGSGGGVIVMKRLEDALTQGDQIYAVIRGSAVNNDGSAKAGYTAPSVDGQADVIVEAIANAEVSAESISYVEAHGSGTPVGDPIEVFALTKAFRNFTQKNNFCAIGSVKTNIGHLDAAAGMAGIIKTALALKHRRLPPTLHYTSSNPEINFPATPFYVNAKALDWKRSDSPFRAGVMSTGMGGTNAHVVLEEAPAAAPATWSNEPCILPLSAKTSSALGTMSVQLADFLSSTSFQSPLSDVTCTLQTGRRQLSHRRFFVCHSKEEAIAALKTPDVEKNIAIQGDSSRPVVFLFPGVGDHYIGMGQELYKHFEVFRREVDRCVQILQPLLNIDIREVLFSRESSPRPASRGIDLKQMLGRGVEKAPDPAAQKLDRTIYCHPALFTLEYALARLWMHWGVQPDRIIGHSMGEYVAACLAEVFSLEDALKLVSSRAKLVNELPQGMMLAVMLPEKELLPMLRGQLSISLINSPNLCIVSGPVSEMTTFQNRLKEQEIVFRPVRNAHAFHSRMMDPIVDPFIREIKRIRLGAPRIPFISNVTGTWITPEQARDPNYWADHARRTARFSDALDQLWKIPDCLPLEIGPGRTLGVLAMQHPTRATIKNPLTFSSLRHHYENESDPAFLLNSVGKLWRAGVDIDWEKLDSRPERRKISLPAYPFERQRYWIETPAVHQSLPALKDFSATNADIADWFYVPTWERTPAPPSFPDSTFNEISWLIIGDRSTFASRFASILKERGATTACAFFGKSFAALKGDTFEIRAGDEDDYLKLIDSLKPGLKKSLNIVHLGPLSASIKSPEAGYDESAQDVGFYSLLNLAKAIGEHDISMPIRLEVVTSQIHEVTGDEKLNPVMATVLAACSIMPKEYPNLISFSVDLIAAPSTGKNSDEAIYQLLGEFHEPIKGANIAYRGKYRWQKNFKAQKLPLATAQSPAEEIRAQGLRPRGVYLITGGTGGIGLVMAKYLAQACQAKLILTRRSPFPEKSTWRQQLASGDLPDSERRIISSLLEIESFGAEVDVVTCEVSDLRGMKHVIAGVQSRHKALHGVIHAAGVIGVGLMQVKTREVADEVFSPKISGSLTLAASLKDIKLDFFGSVSSLASVTMPYAHIDYCAAHAFLDAFAAYFQAEHHCRVLNINWPIWREVGILANMRAQIGVEGWRDEALQKGIATRDAVEALKRAFHANSSHLIISPEDLTQAIKASWNLSDSPGAKGSATPKSLVNRTNVIVEEPKNEIERKVANIWSEALGISPIGLQEDFFALGGHSLLAMRIISDIRREFGKTIPIRSLFSAPTIRQFSSLLDDGRANDTLALSNGLRGTGNGPPLFYVPEMQGYGFLPDGLAPYLKNYCRFYDGLQYPGLTEGEALPESVEEIAAHLVTQIQNVWPQGPCYLLGWSFGGIVAYEIARQLELTGRKVELVMLLDSTCPGSALRKRSLSEVMTLFRRHFSTLDAKERIVFLKKITINKLKFLKMGIDENLLAGPPQPKKPLIGAAFKALARYQPKKYDGKVVLFQIEGWEFYSGFRYAPDTYFGWQRVVHDLQVIRVPGDHISMLNEPAVSEVAKRVKHCLRQISAAKTAITLPSAEAQELSALNNISSQRTENPPATPV